MTAPTITVTLSIEGVVRDAFRKQIEKQLAELDRIQRAVMAARESLISFSLQLSVASAALSPADGSAQQ